MDISRRILIPLNGSVSCERALDLLDPGELAQAAVTLLRVVPGPEEATGARGYLDGLALGLSCAETRVLVRQGGDPARHIVEEAERGQHDLVILMQTAGAVKRLFAGSVTQRVLERCRVPLLLGNERCRVRRGDRVRKVLVPMGEGDADQALAAAQALCVDRDAEAVLLATTELAETDNPLSYSRDRDVSRRKATARLRPHTDRLKKAGAQASTVVKLSAPREGILEAVKSTGADVVVMSYRKAKGALQRVLRPLPERVLRASPVPVLFVPERDAAPPSTKPSPSTILRRKLASQGA